MPKKSKSPPQNTQKRISVRLQRNTEKAQLKIAANTPLPHSRPSSPSVSPFPWPIPPRPQLSVTTVMPLTSESTEQSTSSPFVESTSAPSLTPSLEMKDLLAVIMENQRDLRQQLKDEREESRRRIAELSQAPPPPPDSSPAVTRTVPPLTPNIGGTALLPSGNSTQGVIPPSSLGTFPSSHSGLGTLSLHDFFPDIEESLLLSIIRHTIRPGQISKLDTRVKDRALPSNLDYIDGSIVHQEKRPSQKEFPNFESFHYPLSIYFSIANAHVTSSGNLIAAIDFNNGCHEYLTLLNRYAFDFEWTAVLNYHFSFHARRLAKMLKGDYTSWGQVDNNLHNKFLLNNPRVRAKDKSTASKASSSSYDMSKQKCNDFNYRECSKGSSCTRIHKCRNCDSSDHGVSSCPSKKPN
ncbi:hypothetical protein M422DRAFT_53536 [Sphaerobolus stellatus SS14]|uniref:Unplaced genomic scaffold SPHSTscaffold_174, whole genome shotgun sequence n=1 Tax=Sphaerobolus stellatus (strain SS14) TaxID=990650 RepID=A0A0C9V0W0_SPHS4|nr:hypothetical protein M422DRAFT_53536 [Sphaerobolus stellatus SS14]